jgi:hypothetical protein
LQILCFNLQTINIFYKYKVVFCLFRKIIFNIILIVEITTLYILSKIVFVQGMNHGAHDHHQHLSHYGHNPPTVDSSSSLNVTNRHSNSFCTGHGSIMYMDGFHSSFFMATSGDQPCLNVFFPKWTLDTPFKFLIGGIFFPIALGYITEAVILGWKGTNKNDDSTTNVQKSFLHVLQSLLGFLDMILFMTLSYEIIASLMLGFWLGFFTYHRRIRTSKASL